MDSRIYPFWESGNLRSRDYDNFVIKFLKVFEMELILYNKKYFH